MYSIVRSLWIWFAVSMLLVLWLPLIALIRLFDRDPVRYTTGLWFRRLGVAMTKVNPSWRLTVDGYRGLDPRHPYVIVSNHQSMADIPLISHLGWEMKWIAKKELFKVPFAGWMMSLAGDIPVDRSDRRSGAKMLLQARRYLEQRCSVIFFPEGTRSKDGRVGKFNEGAFHLAVKAGVPILPLAIDGSGGCLPKKTWKFGPAQNIVMRILDPVETAGLTTDDVPRLTQEVRGAILAQVASHRGVTAAEVDAEAAPSSPPITSQIP